MHWIYGQSASSHWRTKSQVHPGTGTERFKGGIWAYSQETINSVQQESWRNKFTIYCCWKQNRCVFLESNSLKDCKRGWLSGDIVDSLRKAKKKSEDKNIDENDQKRKYKGLYIVFWHGTTCCSSVYWKARPLVAWPLQQRAVLPGRNWQYFSRLGGAPYHLLRPRSPTYCSRKSTVSSRRNDNQQSLSAHYTSLFRIIPTRRILRRKGLQSVDYVQKLIISEVITKLIMYRRNCSYERATALAYGRDGEDKTIFLDKWDEVARRSQTMTKTTKSKQKGIRKKTEKQACVNSFETKFGKPWMNRGAGKVNVESLFFIWTIHLVLWSMSENLSCKSSKGGAEGDTWNHKTWTQGHLCHW